MGPILPCLAMGTPLGIQEHGHRVLPGSRDVSEASALFVFSGLTFLEGIVGYGVWGLVAYASSQVSCAR